MKAGKLVLFLPLLAGCGSGPVGVRLESAKVELTDTEQSEPPPPLPPKLPEADSVTGSSGKEQASYNADPTGAASDFTPLRAKAHPLARRLMDEDFYWSPIEESGPFGSDDGAEAYAGFRDWRKTHGTARPILFLTALINRWGYRAFDLQELNIGRLKAYLAKEEIAVMQMSGTDAAIAAIAFGQLYLEGTIDAEFRQLAITSLRRQLLPDMLALWGADYKGTRETQLRKMLAVLMEVK